MLLATLGALGSCSLFAIQTPLLAPYNILYIALATKCTHFFLSARCERHRRERIAAGFARLYRCLPSYDPEAPLPSKHALLLQAAEQLAALRGSADREQDARSPTGPEAGELYWRASWPESEM